MKNKIKKFSKGDFRIIKPDIVFPQTHLTMTIGEGELYHGSFTFQSPTDGEIRGLVYPSSFRVQCSEEGFEGNPIEIKFTYDGTGLRPGHVEQGRFTIVCNGGEYEIAYTALIEKPFILTKYGKVQNVKDFKKLAMQDFMEAQRLFRSREFYEILKYEDCRIYSLYDNMRKWSLGEQGLEEFLLGIKQKERIFLTLSDEEHIFDDILEATKGNIVFTKNTWGYMPIRFCVEGDFIQVARKDTTTEEFVGNTYELEYVVRVEKLHAGNNFGAVIIETPYERITYPVTVVQNSVTNNEMKRELDFLQAQIIKSYLSCVAGRIETNEWVESAIAKVQLLREKEPNNAYFQLLHAHIYLRGKRMEEGEWILESFNYSRFAKGRDPEISSYYLFLTALIKKEGSHVNRVVEEINRLYMRNPHSWKMLCMLIHIDPKLRSYEERLRMLERQFFNGANQILFYVEAYLCYCEKSFLLKKLGTFEIQVLNFAAKYKLMTKELALYTANLASQQKKFDIHLFRVLERCYHAYQEPMILSAICTLLIKGNQVEKKYFQWYEKAVDEELKIAQLYEYYMMTIEAKKVQGAFPRSVYLYFMHGNSLDYEKAAILYANLITYENEASDLFAYYREKINRFAWEQLEKRHINEQLRVIYKRYIVEEELNNERIRALYDVCHAYKVYTKSYNVKYVLVIEKDGKVNQRVPYTEDGAQVFLYDKEARIVWESGDGHHYADSMAYETKRLFYELRFIDMCKKYMEGMNTSEQEGNETDLSIANIQKYGMDSFDEQEVFRLCSKYIREENYEEEEYLSYLSFQLFNKGQYDKVILSYLASYYCGATKDMKHLWKVAKEYDINVHRLSERIITQMLFAEEMFGEEEIFACYYAGGCYFRLKQAYLAYVSKEYIVHARQTDPCVFQIMIEEYNQGEYLADICKVAVLKYYVSRNYGADIEPILQGFLRELCEKNMLFPFYLQYKESWLREVQLYDKVMIEYRANGNNQVNISYQVMKADEEIITYKTELLTPMYENIYVKSFVIFQGEQLKYYFKEYEGENRIMTEKQTCVLERAIEPIGRYGELNAMTNMSLTELDRAMQCYAQEDELSKQIFVAY
ncbi:MAG: DUF5717 family protein [Lachnospiraceae bacterium]